MKETGELLRNRRLEKKFSLEEISSQTKIQLSILKSLEEGRSELLKNKTYIKGFLRQYARALQLNPDDVIALFDKETSEAAPDIAAPSQSITKLKTEQPIQDNTNVLWFRAPAKVITVAGVLVISVLAVAIYFLSMKMASYSAEEVKEEPTATEEQADTPEALPATTDTAAANVTATPGTPTPPATTAPATETPAAKPAEKTPEAAPAATAAPTVDKKEEAAAPVGTKEIIVLATDNVTVEASWSAGEKETVKLKNNGKHSFYYPKKITLTISNGGSVSVTANGEKLGVPGEPGQPVTLAFE